VTGALQPAQRRVDGTRGQVKGAAAAGLQRLDHRVSVPGTVGQDGQQDRVQVPAQRVGLHA